MSKLDVFIAKLKESVARGDIYIWGAQGQKLSDMKNPIEWIKNRETSASNAARAIKLYEVRKNVRELRAFDCSGLGCFYMEQVGAVPKGFDTTADGLKGNCKKIANKDIRKGCFVFKCYENSGKAYHIGYVVDDNLTVIEAQGRDAGVVSRPFAKGMWNWYGIPKYFESDINANTWTCSRLLKLTLPTYMEGEDIANVQKALRLKGYDITTITGKYGTQTQDRVRKFQKDNGLTVDGICGKNTITKLGGKWNG